MKSLALHRPSHTDPASSTRAPAKRLIDRVEIAAPCHASWDDMVGDQRARFCGQCAKNVYNVSAMSAAEVEALITDTEGRACLRLYKRKDGTVMTTDCPVGLAERAYKKARRVTLAAVAMVVTLSAGLFASLFKPTCNLPDDGVMMGAVAPVFDPGEAMMGEPAYVPEVPVHKPPAPAPSVKMGKIMITDLDLE